MSVIFFVVGNLKTQLIITNTVEIEYIQERNLTDVMFVEKGFRMEVVMLFIVEYILEKNLMNVRM